MPSTILPPALQPGATIALISPSARLNHLFPAVMSRATAILTSRGYKVRELYTPDTTIQSSITNRLSEIRTAFSDPEISAIICVIGGSTFTELLPALIADTELHATIRANPKVFVGYSDITGFHWFLHALTGLRTFYGPGANPELGEASTVEDDSSPLSFCVKHLFHAITSLEPLGDVPRSLTYAPRPAPHWKNADSTQTPELALTLKWLWIRAGKAQGRLFGGCLSVMARLAGIRAIAPSWRGRIVFFETSMGEDGVSGNALPRVRAGIADLIAQGVFEEAAGLVVGRAFGYDSDEQRDEYVGVIRGLLCDAKGKAVGSEFPILFGVDFGHTTPMVTLPFDALAELDSERDRFAILESGII